MNQSPEVVQQDSDPTCGAPTHPEVAPVDGIGVGEPLEPRVLIVDDEAAVLGSLRRLLRHEPYELLLADSGAAALKLLETCPCPVVVSDQCMAGMTGIELLEEVRRRWPETIRIIISGYSAINTIIAAINEGAVYKFLSKPWNDEEIKGNIRQALEQYELGVENRRMSREIAAQNERLRRLNAELDQRAADASAGLNSIQELQDAIAAGVITFDDSELIVGANRLAGEMLSSEVGLCGMPAGEVLPPALYQALFPADGARDEAASGRLQFSGCNLQWRLRTVHDGTRSRGLVATIWQEVE
ncbi:MAG: response regulator [Phycisphaerae bacterium]